MARSNPRGTTSTENADKLREALRELRLSEMLASLEQELLAGPRDDDSRLDFLWRIVEPQWIARRQRSLEYRISRAMLPEQKTFDGFNFAFQPNLNKDRVLELAGLDFVRRGENLLVAGMSGTGKSHICIAIGHLACRAGLRVRYTTSADMLTALAAAASVGALDEALKEYVRPELLIIDEVGLDRVERAAVADAQLFYKVIRPRHERARSTALTSNIDWEDWGKYLGDDIATAAVLDRLIEHGHLITIKGPSYRAEEHARLNAPAATEKGRGTKPRSKR
jgi:DNA replication protein DnaC